MCNVYYVDSGEIVAKKALKRVKIATKGVCQRGSWKNGRLEFKFKKCDLPRGEKEN